MLQHRYTKVEKYIKSSFVFLVKEFGFTCTSVREHDVGTRDEAMIVSYMRDKVRIYVSWSDIENSMRVSFRFDYDELQRDERSAYLEPIIRYVTGGKLEAVAPVQSRGDNIRETERKYKERQAILEENMEQVVLNIGKQLHDHLADILELPPNVIRKHHLLWQDRMNA